MNAPPYLFGECFTVLAKERLQGALVLKKPVSGSASTKQGFQKITLKDMLKAMGKATDTTMTRETQGTGEDSQQEQAMLPGRVLLQQRND